MESLGQQTANLGCSDGTFRPKPKLSIELSSMAVFMAPLNLSWSLVKHTALYHIWLCSGWNVPLELPRSAVLWPNHYHGWKVPLELPRSAVLWSDHRTAKGGSSNPQKKVWIELPRLAVLMALFRTANSGSCSQVYVKEAKKYLPNQLYVFKLWH